MVNGAEDRRLLEPGWAGELDDDEVVFIQRELPRDRKAFLDWGFRGGQGLAEAKVRRVARWGVSSDVQDHRKYNRRLNQNRIAVPADGSHPLWAAA